VAPVREQGGSGAPVELPVVFVDGRPEGYWELMICRGCGRTEWRARDVPSGLPERRGACPSCGPVRLLSIDSAVEHDANARPRALTPLPSAGRFEVQLCSGCGVARWFARELELGALPRCDSTCAGCGASPLARIATVREHGELGPTALHLALHDAGLFYYGVGRLAAELCPSCGLTEWLARGFDSVDGVEETAAPPRRGPYR
jgi:hypothetical protein